MGVAMTNRWKFRLAAGLLLIIAGCSRGHDGRCALGGSVSLASLPVDGGHIQFASLTANRASTSGAVIHKGRYSIPAENGLAPGKYRVRIYWPEKIVFKPGPNPLPKERIPAKYNVGSELTVEVQQGRSNNFDFAVEP